jgi:hypothetical protein
VGDHRWLLSDVLAAVMVSVATYGIGRLVLSVGARRTTQRESDVVHTAMGISMAGMLLPSFAAVPTGLWVVVFSVSTFWFGWRAARLADDAAAGAHALGQHLPHLLMSAAMVYMLVFAEWSGSMSRSGAMPTVHSNGAQWPLVTVVLAVLLLGDGVLSFGLNLRRVGPPHPEGGVAVATPRLLAPRAALVCQLVMSLVMGYMLLSLA